MTDRAVKPSWLRRSLTTVFENFITVGRDPKVRDTANSQTRVGNSLGNQVNAGSAMGVATFWACVRLISSTIGSLPLPAYKRDAAGNRVVNRGAPLHRIFNEAPNADQTPVDYLELAIVSMLLRGDHFARKVKEGSRLVALEPINPAIVSVSRLASGMLGYRWTDGGERFDLTEEDVFHVRGFGGGPIRGLSILSQARESIGLALAADKAAGAVFANGVSPGGILSTDAPLTPAQQGELETLLSEKYQGSVRRGMPMVLGHGLTWSEITLKADEAQLLQSRAWSVQEICRWFGVPPFMVGHNEGTTAWGTGIEQMLLGFQKFTLNPYLRRFEQAVRKQLLTPSERAAGATVEFNLDGLLRADTNARSRFYESGLRNKWITINEVRAKENLPPVPWGDEPIVQQQDIPLSDRLEMLVQEMQNAS